MSLKRMLLEIGTGNDLHGGDYTKAAVRAVEDAIHHGSLSFLRALNVNPATMMHVAVTVGVQNPDNVDTARVAAALPHGKVTVQAVPGGLDVPDETAGDTAVIATAAVVVSVDLPD